MELNHALQRGLMCVELIRDVCLSVECWDGCKSACPAAGNCHHWWPALLHSGHWSLYAIFLCSVLCWLCGCVVEIAADVIDIQRQHCDARVSLRGALVFPSCGYSVTVTYGFCWSFVFTTLKV